MTESNFTIGELENEEWRSIARYKDLYSVSNLGKVRRNINGTGHAIHAKAGMIFSCRCSKKGYVRVTLRTPEGQPRSHFVHRLVAAAFIGERPTGMQVNHKDPKTGKSNNRASNLEYCTPKQNMEHAVQHGLMASGLRNGAYVKPECVNRGDKNGRTIIKDRDIPLVFSLYAQGLSQREIGEIVGTGQTNISSILRGERKLA